MDFDHPDHHLPQLAPNLVEFDPDLDLDLGGFAMGLMVLITVLFEIKFTSTYVISSNSFLSDL